jgi:hypothetical protein
MTTLTKRMIKGDFVVTGPDIEPMPVHSEQRTDMRGSHTLLSVE